jgi:hypothetical protein
MVSGRVSGVTPQSYATLRGRKWSDKQRAGGCGDNYGRQQRHQMSAYFDDSRSLASFTDDFLAVPPSASAHHHHHHHHHPEAAHGGAYGAARGSMTRSTDRDLDSLGLSDEELLVTSASGVPMRSSDEVLTLLTREPPDGKEKPEPSKSSKAETLSRKNSKCDLLEFGTASTSSANRTASVSSTGSLQQQAQSDQAGVVGDTASLLSVSVAGGKSDSGVGSSSGMKRDSLKDSNSVFFDGSSCQDQDTDSAVGSSLQSKDW